MRLLCIYQVMFQYRVGTYEAISRISGVDFELWHGKDVPNTKLNNFKGHVSFRHKQIGCLHLPVKTNNGASSQPFFPFLFFRLIRYNPDVILAEGASSLFSLSVAFLYAQLFGKKIIMWSLGNLAGREHHGIRGLIQKWIRVIERGVDALFVYSSQAENYFIHEGVEPRKIFKAINVIDTNSKIASLKENGFVKKDSGFNVVFVGAINKSKRLELLIDSVGELSKKYHDIRLHIIGEGNYLEAIKDYVKVIGLEDKVVFHGRVVSGLNTLLAKYHVLALPGLGGLAIVDGMISSLPIISGRADGTELDLIDDSNGFVTDNMTKEYMLEKIDYLYNNQDVALEMGEKSYKKITSEFSFDNYIRQFQNCLNFVSHEK